LFVVGITVNINCFLRYFQITCLPFTNSKYNSKLGPNYGIYTFEALKYEAERTTTGFRIQKV